MLESRAVQFLKNFYYTITSNLISLFISTLVVLVVPKLVGVEEYGYWQLYIFYSSYVGFLHLGWSDGIYLRYGGEEYKNLDKRTFSSQFYLMVFFQIFIAVIICLMSFVLVKDSDRIFILSMVAINLIIVNVLSVLLLTLQATNQIKDYANINIISRVSYILLIISFLFFGVREYKIMIIADLFGKGLSLVYAIYTCKDIVLHKLDFLSVSITETAENIRVGSKLMFANIASMLIIGVVRFGIEYSWDVATFGKISLTLSVSSLLMLFINAVGIVIFPVLRKLNQKTLPGVYLVIRDVLMACLFAILLLYFPMNMILSNWLPNYADSLAYMALLFPISIYEGKMGLLINTYLKTLRKEKYIMRVNIIVLLISVITTFFTTIIFKNLNAAIVSILVVILIRSILAELYVASILGVKVLKDIIYEVMMTAFFVLSGWYMHSSIGFIVYFIAIILYFIVKRKNIKSSYNMIRKYTYR